MEKITLYTTLVKSVDTCYSKCPQRCLLESKLLTVSTVSSQQLIDIS